MGEVGKKTEKKTQAGRDVYKTPEGEMVSEKSTTFKYKGKWINIPSIHNGYSYDDDTLILMLEAGLIKPTSTHSNKKEAEQAARKRSDNLNFNKGGTPMMEQQMELFKRGGLNDQGGEVDEVSGNEVPVGGTKKGVRDDIPAMVSEGEFVFPEDVVRYIGLDKLMTLRQQAKMGLKKMEAMGQMGNGDEATIPDDLPFDMADLIIVAGDTGEELEMQEGGFVRRPTTVTRTAQQPTYAQPPVSILPMPPEEPVFRSVRPLTPQIERPAPSVVNFDRLMGDARINFKEYRNESGQSILIPFLGDSPIFPIPEGYSLYQPSAEETSTEEQEAVEEVNEALENAPRNSSESESSSAIVRNEFTEAGSWEGVPLDMYIKEATKFVDGTSSLATGVMGALGGLPMGLFTRVATSNQKKRILATIDKRIEEAKGTPVEGQVAQLRKIKAILEGKEDAAGAFDKVKNIVKGILAPEEVKQQTVKVAESTPVKMETPESDAALTEQVQQYISSGVDPFDISQVPPTSISLPVVADPEVPITNLDDRDTMREIAATGIMPTGEKAFDVIPDLSKDPAYASTILPTGTGGLSRDESLQPDEIQRRTQRIQAEDPIAKRKELASVYQTPSVVTTKDVQDRGFAPTNIAQPAATAETIAPTPTTTTPIGRDIDVAFDPVPVQQPVQTTFDTFVTADGTVTKDDATRTPLGFAAAADSRRKEQAALQDQMATAIPTTTVDPRTEDRGFVPINIAQPAATVETIKPVSEVTTSRGFVPTNIAQPAATVETIKPVSEVVTGRGFVPTNVAQPAATSTKVTVEQPISKPQPKDDKATTTAQPSLAPDVSLRPKARPTTTKSKDDRPTATTTSKSTNIASSGRSEADIQKEINVEIKKAGKDGWNDKLNDLVAERDSARANEGGSRDGGGGGDAASKDKIVCTEMYRQTQLADWQHAMKIWDVYHKKHLTPYHQTGYHWLFQPYVKGMRKSTLLTKLGAALAKHRTQHLRYILTKGKAKDDIIGNVWCKIVHPVVYIAGIIKEKMGK